MFTYAWRKGCYGSFVNAAALLTRRVYEVPCSLGLITCSVRHFRAAQCHTKYVLVETVAILEDMNVLKSAWVIDIQSTHIILVSEHYMY